MIANAGVSKERTFARRIIREMYGPIKKNGIWRSKFNIEICKAYSE